MNFEVDENKCIGCGSCVSITDNKFFDFNDDGKAIAIKNTEPTEEDIENINNAIEFCPTGAIEKK